MQGSAAPPPHSRRLTGLFRLVMIPSHRLHCPPNHPPLPSWAGCHSGTLIPAFCHPHPFPPRSLCPQDPLLLMKAHAASALSLV